MRRQNLAHDKILEEFGGCWPGEEEKSNKFPESVQFFFPFISNFSIRIIWLQDSI